MGMPWTNLSKQRLLCGQGSGRLIRRAIDQAILRYRFRPQARPLLDHIDHTVQERGKRHSSHPIPPIEQPPQSHRYQAPLLSFVLTWSHSLPRRSWTCDFKVRMVTRCPSPCKADSVTIHGGSSLKYLTIPVRKPPILNEFH